MGGNRYAGEERVIEDFLEDGKWKCIACGACCMDVRKILPQWLGRDGKRCKNLQEDMKCAIYEDRPLICQARASTALMGMAWDERKMAGFCEFLNVNLERRK